MCLICVKYMLFAIEPDKLVNCEVSSICPSPFCSEKLQIGKRCPHMAQRRFTPKEPDGITYDWSLMSNHTSLKYSTGLTHYTCRRCMHKGRKNPINYYFCHNCGFFLAFNRLEYGFVGSHVKVDPHSCNSKLERNIHSQLDIWSLNSELDDNIKNWLFAKGFSSSTNDFTPTNKGMNWFKSQNFTTKYQEWKRNIDNFIENWTSKLDNSDKIRVSFDTTTLYGALIKSKQLSWKEFLSCLKNSQTFLIGNANQKAISQILNHQNYILFISEFVWAELNSKLNHLGSDKERLSGIRVAIIEEIKCKSYIIPLNIVLEKIGGIFTSLIQEEIKTIKLESQQYSFSRDADIKDVFIYLYSLYNHCSILITFDKFLLHLGNDRILSWKNDENRQRIYSKFSTLFAKNYPLAWIFFKDHSEEFLNKIIESNLEIKEYIDVFRS